MRASGAGSGGITSTAARSDVGRAQQRPGAAGRLRRRDHGRVRRLRSPGRRSRPGRRPSRGTTRAERRADAPQHGGPGRWAHRDAPDARRRSRPRSGTASRTAATAARDCRVVEDLGRAERCQVVAQPCRCGRRPTRRNPRCAPASPTPPKPASAGTRAAARPAARRRPRRRTANRAPPTAPPRPRRRRGPAAPACRSPRGAGSTFNVTSVMTASVPWLPVSSLHRSRPVTFFSTRPPEWITSPRPVTARTPSTWSRIAPQATRRGPERLVATTPPSVCALARAEQRGEVGRLGDDVLAVLGQRRLDLGERRAGARGDDQLLRRVERDAGERRAVESVRAACTGRSMPRLVPLPSDRQAARRRRRPRRRPRRSPASSRGATASLMPRAASAGGLMQRKHLARVQQPAADRTRS